MIERWGLAGVMVLCAVTAVVAAEKPRVPAGRDPGGVAIAIVGPGVDYTQVGIAERLARDGEGEIVGFDLIDGDRRPYVAASTQAEKAALQQLVGPLLEPEVPSRLAVFRAKSGERLSVAQAISFVSKSPARIVFLTGGFPESPAPDFEFLAAASKQFPELLFVVPAGDQAVELDATEREAMPNVLIVVAASSGGVRAAKVVDVATDGGSPGGDSQLAAARVAGLAARVSAENAALGGASLKAAIVALAKADLAEGAVKTRYGVIEKTGADFRAK